MSKIKICGLRRPEDIEAVNRVKPEYVGFVFAKGKRQVSVELVRGLVEMLDPYIKKVGVFVNENAQNILNTVVKCDLDIVQLHGDETPDYVEELIKPLKALKKNRECIWKAVRVKDEESLKTMDNYRVDAFLLDSFSSAGYGGTGETFDWELAAQASSNRKIIVAGGLNAGNIIKAIRIVKPYCVDVSSGVEVDGYKDRDRIYEFVASARNYD